MTPDLAAQVAAGLVGLAEGHGFRVRLDGNGGLTLERVEAEATCPPDLFEALQAARDDVLALLATECEECGKCWYVPVEEVRRMVRHPWACDRGGQEAYGKKEFVAGCPYRRTDDAT